VKLQRMSRKQRDSILWSNSRLNLWSGSVRSGKTIASIIRWLHFVAHAPPGNLLMVGKTERTLRRNILDVITEIVGPENFTVISGLGECTLYGRKIYLAGANDERSESKIRGITLLAGYGDEITLWPESFFAMLLSRLSEPGAKFFGTTNPDGPGHWLKKDYIDRKEQIGLNLYTFTLEDNETLPTDYVDSLKREYTGLWYKRYILGLWVAAEGAIYDMFDESKHVISGPLPPMVEEIVGVDYGTANPSCFLKLGYVLQGDHARKWIVSSEYYFDGRKGRQKTDVELGNDLTAWLGGSHPSSIQIDPSAASFKAQLRSMGVAQLRDADNSVLDGIRTVASMLTSGKLLIHESCKHLLEEIPGYAWDSKKQDRGLDAPIKVDDHCCDALRYACMRAASRRF